MGGVVGDVYSRRLSSFTAPNGNYVSVHNERLSDSQLEIDYVAPSDGWIFAQIDGTPQDSANWIRINGNNKSDQFSSSAISPADWNKRACCICPVRKGQSVHVYSPVVDGNVIVNFISSDN